MCGKAFYHYDHFDPEFADATEHNADGITLLCAEHHDEKNRNRSTIEMVQDANANPKAITLGQAAGSMNFPSAETMVQIAGAEFRAPESLLSIDGVSVLSVKPAVGTSGILLTLRSDAQGLCEIVDNEWIGRPAATDITTESNRIVVRHQDRVALQMRNVVGDRLVIEHIDLTYQSIRVLAGPLRPGQDPVLRILNRHGLEICRVRSSKGHQPIKLTWPDALRITGDLMDDCLIGLTASDGDFVYQTASKPQVRDCSITGGSLSVGGPSETATQLLELATSLQGTTDKFALTAFDMKRKAAEKQKLLEQLQPIDRTTIRSL